MAASSREIDWERLDKGRFFVYGAGMFSGVSTVLYPLSVMKTHQMASSGSVAPGLKGVSQVASRIMRQEGLLGFYKGFSTVIGGSIPSRFIYLTTLEVMRTTISSTTAGLELGPAATAGVTNFVAGGVASLSTQLVIAPVDVISSRQIMHRATDAMASTSGRVEAAAWPGGGRGRVSGAEMARHIIRTEGVRGLYRGLGAAVLTYAPSSAVWWAAYGVYQKLIWSTRDDMAGGAEGAASEVFLVQAAAAAMAGATSGVLTTPLDVVKTRIQVSGGQGGGRPAGIGDVVQQVIARDGIKGMWRGAAPRAINVALWGTCMVSTYELLKRMCAKPL